MRLRPPAFHARALAALLAAGCGGGDDAGLDGAATVDAAHASTGSPAPPTPPPRPKPRPS